MAAMSDYPAIVVDTREQTPLDFGDLPVLRGTLKAGDYSLVGYESRVAVERKSWADCWSSMTTGRARFERCVARLAEMDRAAIVIECTLAGLCERPMQIQRATPASVIGGLISWSVKYNVPVFFAGNREFAARVTMRYLAGYLKHRVRPSA